MFANICICVLWLLQGLNMKNENWKMRIVIVIMWLQKSASLSLPLSLWIIPYNGPIFQLQKGGPTTHERFRTAQGQLTHIPGRPGAWAGHPLSITAQQRREPAGWRSTPRGLCGGQTCRDNTCYTQIIWTWCNKDWKPDVYRPFRVKIASLKQF